MALAMAQKHSGQVFTEGPLGCSRPADPVEGPLLLIEVVAQALDVADVIEDHRLLSRLGPQAAADHLKVQGQALGGPQQQTAPHRRDIHPLADEAAAGEHLQLTALQRLEELAALERLHRAID
jgi:hypothetical protein